MDRICVNVLNKINSQTGNGKYAVISADEFTENFPEGSEKTREELERALRALESNGFIDLKYNKGDMYCVAGLKEYQPEEQPVPPPAPVPAEKTHPTHSEFIFICAFAGGALGSFIISLIFALV